MLTYLFLVLPGLCCCTGLSLVVAIRGSSPGGVPGFSRQWSLFLRARAPERADSVAAACGPSRHGPQALENRLISCGPQTWLLHDMWDLPQPGIKPVSPALAGRFFTTEPPGTPQWFISLIHFG